jgi:pyridoxamine 5'-phosphate oxidase
LLSWNFLILPMDLPIWRSPLSRALHRNRSVPDARYVQLATIADDQRPRNRTVVFRGFHDSASQLQFVTDVRSSKAEQITQNSWAEVCWYFSKTREQFRIAGQMQLISDRSVNYQAARIQAWQQLSLASREQFAWPLPAAPRDLDISSFAVSLPPVEQPLANFGLLLLRPIAVDHLELRGAPQNRWQYRWDNDEWLMDAINP